MGSAVCVCVDRNVGIEVTMNIGCEVGFKDISEKNLTVGWLVGLSVGSNGDSNGGSELG